MDNMTYPSNISQVNQKIYIIAEIGFNHEGDIPLAVQMIEEAAKAGANAIKFQTYRAVDLALPSASHYGMIKCGEMNLKQHKELAKCAHDCGVDFLSTPYSPWAIDLLEQVGVPAYKVASMDCTNKYLLRYIAQTHKPVYLSTGMATLSEIAEILHFLEAEKSGPVTLLHCVSLYPVQAGDLHLDIIPLLKKMFNIPVGYSDHYPGIAACLAAVMLGAEIIETHFTLDTSRQGGDHHHSADPAMIKHLVNQIELFILMKGDAHTIYERPDRQWTNLLRRGIYAAKHLAAGSRLKEEGILCCRPTSTFSPNDLDWLKGKILSQDIDKYEAIDRSDLKS